MTAAQRVIEAFNTLNPDTSIFAPESVTWHSFDESEVPTIPDTFAALRAFRSVSPDFRFNDARCEETDGDLSWARYVLSGTLPDGSTFRAPAALAVITGSDGRVVRLEEFVDQHQVAPLVIALGAAGHNVGDTGQ